MKGDTTAASSYPSGASLYGALDLAGNVWEWVDDLYDESCYSQSPARNPTRPKVGTLGLLRGGSWGNVGGSVRSAGRLKGIPDLSSYYIGFR
jgi:formylglycine-generating enzyme required for sulfatase activity